MNVDAGFRRSFLFALTGVTNSSGLASHVIEAMHASTRADSAPEICFDLPGSSLPHGIVIHSTVLDDVRAAAVDGLFKLKSVGLEAGGVLFGRIRDGAAIVSRAARFEPAYAFGPAWRLADADMQRFRELLTATEGPDEAAVGFFVSHTRMEPVLSEHNLALFDAAFPDGRHIALVVKPHVFLPMRCVVHYRSAAGELSSSSEFAYDDADPQEPAAGDTDVEGSSPAALSGADQLLPEVRDLAASKDTRVEQPLRRSVRAWAGAGAALAGALAVAAFLFWNRLPRAIEPAPPVAPRTTAETSNSTPATVAPAVPMPEAPPAAAPSPDEKRVKELQNELERLKTELAQQNSPQQNSRTNAQPNATMARKFVPPQTAGPVAGAADRSAPAFRLELEQPPAITAAPSAPKLPGSTVAVAAPPPVAATPTATAPAAGRLLWTGNLRKGALLFIENSRASAGSLIGALPGHPARVVVEPATLTDGGMVVYTADHSRAGRSEAPSAENGWNATAFQYDPKQAQDVTVIEAPTAQNQWRKLVLRTNRAVSVVMISWH